jgi:hypothetical protein
MARMCEVREVGMLGSGVWFVSGPGLSFCSVVLTTDIADGADVSGKGGWDVGG